MGACTSCLAPRDAVLVLTELDKAGAWAKETQLSNKEEPLEQPGSGAAPAKRDSHDSSAPSSTIAAGQEEPPNRAESPFLKWAQQQAFDEDKPLVEFLERNTNATSSSGRSQDSSIAGSSHRSIDTNGSTHGRISLDRTGSTHVNGEGSTYLDRNDSGALHTNTCSISSSRRLNSVGSASLDAWSSALNSGSASGRLPYQPFDAFLHGAPKPACQEERVVVADGIQQMRATKDGELENMLDALTAAFDCDTAATTLLTGECIAVCAAKGQLSPGICPDRWGFCGWSFMNTNHELLVVENLREDTRFAENFFIVDPAFALASYFAAPLISTNGHRLGTLCVLGQEPRKFDATRAQLLANMAEMLVRQMEANWAMQLAAQKAGQSFTRSLACYTMAYMLVDTSKPGWAVMYMNLAAENQLGLEWATCKELVSSCNDNELDEPKTDGVGLHRFFDLQAASTTWAPHCCEFTVREVQGAPRTPLEGRNFTLTFRLATGDGLDAEQPFHVGVPSWLQTATDGFGQSLFFMQVSAAAESSCGGASITSSASASSAATPAILSSWSSVLSNNASVTAFIPRGMAPDVCPIEGLVLGPLLGKGSYGRVYRGVYGGVPVAVKIIEDAANLRTTDAGEPLEAMLTQGINHLGIMRTITYAYAKDKASCWMLFEYCDCACVQDAVVKGWFRTDRRPTHGGINLRTVALTAYEIASAMAFLHKHNIVHGDLKGGNVMLSCSSVNAHGFTAKVGDFGLARQAAAADGPRCPPNMYGTVTHMPPEVLLKGQTGKPMDVYSFGVLLWEMLTGARAWAGMRHTQIICQVALLKRQLAMPEGLPPAMHSLLARCMALHVENRCTFEDVLAVLSDFLQTTRHDDMSSVSVTLPKVVA